MTNYMISEQCVVCASASKWTSRGSCVEETELADLAVISGVQRRGMKGRAERMRPRVGVITPATTVHRED